MESPSDAPPSGRALLRAGGGLAVALGLSGCLVSTTAYTETIEESTDRRINGRLGDDAEHALERRSTNGDARVAPS